MAPNISHCRRIEGDCGHRGDCAYDGRRERILPGVEGASDNLLDDPERYGEQQKLKERRGGDGFFRGEASALKDEAECGQSHDDHVGRQGKDHKQAAPESRTERGVEAGIIASCGQRREEGEGGHTRRLRHDAHGDEHDAPGVAEQAYCSFSGK